MGSIEQMILSGEMQFYVSAGTLIVIIIGAFKLGSIFKSLKNDISKNTDLIEYNKNDITENSENITDLKDENNNIKINQAVVQTKLDNIEVGIVDIKAMLTTHVNK